jgi:hypothetical protein
MAKVAPGLLTQPHVMLRCALRLLAVLALLFGGVAQAASGLEASRASAQKAREAVVELRKQQTSWRQELSEVSTRIQTLKAGQKGNLLTGPELDGALRRSQELSGLLTQAAQQMAQVQAEQERQFLALLQVISSELERTTRQWERSKDRDERGRLLEQMKALRQEREQARTMIPASRLPPLSREVASDDPTELREQADALRDSEDKVRQQMKTLKARVHELREERELDRRMGEFLGDEARFDEHDRRLRLSHERILEVRTGTQPPLSGDSGASPQPPMSEGAPTGDFQAGGGSQPGGNDARSSSMSLTQIARGTDSRPQLGGLEAELHAGGEGNDLESMEAQLKRLEKLARELNQKANQLENRAKKAD